MAAASVFSSVVHWSFFLINSKKASPLELWVWRLSFLPCCTHKQLSAPLWKTRPEQVTEILAIMFKLSMTPNATDLTHLFCWILVSIGSVPFQALLTRRLPYPPWSFLSSVWYKTILGSDDNSYEDTGELDVRPRTRFRGECQFPDKLVPRSAA